jgi:hyperosmotically inducible protein
VEKVDNQIEVLPLSPNDDRIRRATYMALVRNQQLSRYFMQAVAPIRIIVKNGNVTLEGVVDTKGDSDMANITAKGVSGAFSVTNHLRVEK